MTGMVDGCGTDDRLGLEPQTQALHGRQPPLTMQPNESAAAAKAGEHLPLQDRLSIKVGMGTPLLPRKKSPRMGPR